MCGRYALYGPVSRSRRQFSDDWDVVDFDERIPPLFDRYNIAPSQLAPVVRVTPASNRQCFLATWGLLPSWVKDPSKVAHPINAKCETAADRPMFRHALRGSRVIVPASGFYEWQPAAGHKQPFFVRPVGVELFGFGGLLEHWKGPEGDVTTFTILTTSANELMQPIHDRMPVIIQREDYAAWLDPGLTEPEILRELMTPFPADLMEAYPVGRAVGNPRSQGPDLIKPIA